MKSYLTEPDSCQHSSEACHAPKIRQPLRVLQIFSVLEHPSKMSASARSGVPRSNHANSRQFAESKLKKNSTTSSSLLKERSTANASRVNTRSVSPNTVGNKVLNQPILSTSRTRSNKLLTEQKNKNANASDTPSSKVGSLTSSPKWSRIKDKFENTDTDSKGKLTRSSSLSRSEIESLTPKKFTSQSSSKSLTSLSFESNLTSQSSTVENHSSSSKSSIEHFKSMNAKHRLQSHVDDKLKTKFNSVPASDAHKKEASDISKSNSNNLVASKTDGTSEKKSKSAPLSAKAVASRLMPSTAADKSEQKTNISAASKKSLKDRPIMGYGPQNFGKLSGRRSPYRNVSQATRTKTEDTKEVGKNETKNALNKTSGTIKDVFQVSNKSTSSAVHQCNNINSTSSGDNPPSANLPSHTKGNVKSVWVKDNIGGWRKQNTETNSCHTDNSDSKVAILKNKCGLFSSGSTVQGTEESNKSQLLRSSTTSNVPAKQSCDDTSEMIVRQLNKSKTTSNISSVTLLKNQNGESRSVSDLGVNKTELSESPKQLPHEHTISLENKLRNCHASGDENAKQGSPENIRKLRLVQKAVLCYEGNSSTLSPETQRRLKLISEKIKAETDDDKLLVAKAKVEMLSANAFRKHNPSHSKSNGERSLATAGSTQKSKADGEQPQSARTFVSRYQNVNKQAEDAKKTNLSTTATDRTESSQKVSVVHGQSVVKQVSGLGSKSAVPKQNTTKRESSIFAFCKSKSENRSVEKDLPHNSKEKKSSNAKESPEHNTYANYVVDDRFLFAKEKQFSKKLPHTTGKLEHPLQPNTSFLWRNSSSTEEESKGVYATTAKQTEVDDDHNYYDLENYYSSLETNREKRKLPKVGEPIYSDSEYPVSGRSNGSVTSFKMNGPHPSTQTAERGKFDTDDGWTDLSDEDMIYDESSSKTNSMSSTLKKKKNKKHGTRKAPLRRSWSQSLRDLANASDSCENSDWVENESNLSSPRIYNEDMADHLYEPVYESLGNYLVTDKENDVPLSPDSEPVRYAHSSFTSLESEENCPPASKQNEKLQPDVPVRCPESSVGIGKKAGDKIRQLKRHLSWTKNDIKLELTSKSNKIKIQKDLNDTTEIGVRVQEDSQPSVTSKKKTFIRCILKHKNSNVPAKRTVSPKKENAMFYVHLSMGREKQRPFSDSCVDSTSVETAVDGQAQKTRKGSDPSISFVKTRNSSQQSMRQTKTASSGSAIQRPKTPPPLPPTNYSPKDSAKRGSSDYGTNKGSGPKLLHKGESEDSAYKSYSSYDSDCVSVGNSSLVCDVRKSYSVPDSKSYVLKTAPQDTAQHRLSDDLLEFQIEHRQSITSLSSIIDSFPVSSIFFQRTRGSLASSVSGESYAPADESGSSGTSSSTAYSLGMTPPASEADGMDYGGSRTGSLTSGLSLPPFGDFKNDFLKSPFEEEPMYQFYHKDVQQRATLWCTTDGSESEFEDDMINKPIDQSTETPKSPPVLQSQLSAMELIHGEGGQRTLWCEVPEVQQSGILEKISPQDRKIQEAMFEVITSEASYLKSLNFLLEHFVQCPEFSGDYSEKHVLDKRERHVLFSDIPPVRDVSARLLADLEKRWLENILLSNICDIIYHHASKYFSVYVKYCSNQLYQERTLKELKENRPEFMEVLKRLESNPVCQGLDMHSFLLLPMQRITRLPLLIDAVFHRISIESPIHESCKMALATLNKIVAECNEGARKMERMEEMLLISHQLDFRECKGFGLLSASRWLVKKGELVHLLLDTTSRRTFGKAVRWSKIHLYVFLFTDLLVITRKKSDDSYSVMDYCPRNMVQVMPVDENTAPLPARLPSSYKNLFQLIMLNNQDGRTIEMILSCLLESDRTRWMDALTPAKSENPDEKIYEEWDCPQVQCTHSYTALQPDELSLEEADVVNVFRKMADGWYEGERIRDGVRGWFPSSHTVEIISSHVRARNLRQRYRLLVLSQNYLEEQYRVQAVQAKGK